MRANKKLCLENSNTRFSATAYNVIANIGIHLSTFVKVKRKTTSVYKFTKKIFYAPPFLLS